MEFLSAFWQVTKQSFTDFFKPFTNFSNKVKTRIYEQRKRVETGKLMLKMQENRYAACSHTRDDGGSVEVIFADGGEGMRWNKKICQWCQLVSDVPPQDPPIIRDWNPGKMDEFQEAVSENFFERFEKAEAAQ